MNRLRRFYNQNRYIIWMVILTVIAIITIIQILNKFAFEKNKNENIINENIVTTINKNYSIVTGQEVKEETPKIIEEFIDYCNNEEIEKAYELLSDDCKEILYPSLNDFMNMYYNKIFTEKKTYVYQSWIAKNNVYTYKVDFVGDMLATGTASQTSISDYYTVVKNNGEYELNINKFIGIKDINKTETNNNVTINIKRKRIYMDYETYEIEIKNNTQNEIMLDDLENTKTVYLEDNNEKKYYWYSHEILENDVLIARGHNRKIKIKFDKEYKPSNEATKIVFSNIVINNKEIIKIDVLI